MLVLTRKTQEQIQIGDNVKITIVRIKGRSVRVGIDAPRNVRVVRGELTFHDDALGGDDAPSQPAEEGGDEQEACSAARPRERVSALRQRPPMEDYVARARRDPLRGASLSMVRRQPRLRPRALASVSCGS